MKGGGRLGGINPAAGQMVPQPLQSVPQGFLTRFFLTVAFTVISTGAAFATSVGTGFGMVAEGSDDADKLLNAVLASLQLFLRASRQTFNLTPAQLRTVLALLNQRAMVGSLLSGPTVPISSGSALAVKAILPIPLSLDAYIRDGRGFGQGSEGVRTGQINWNFGASLTPTVVLANGSAVVGGLAVSTETEFGVGSPHDVGPTWRVERSAGQPNIVDLAPAIRLAFLDVQPAGSNPVSAYNTNGQQDSVGVTPNALAAAYESERGMALADDITSRCTPILWLPRETVYSDVPKRPMPFRVDAASGASALGYYDIQAETPSASEVAKQSALLGGGGPVVIGHPTPPSLPPGSVIPAGEGALLPSRPQIQSPSAQGIRVASPLAAAVTRTQQNSPFAGIRFRR